MHLSDFTKYLVFRSLRWLVLAQERPQFLLAHDEGIQQQRVFAVEGPEAYFVFEGHTSPGIFFVYGTEIGNVGLFSHPTALVSERAV